MRTGSDLSEWIAALTRDEVSATEVVSESLRRLRLADDLTNCIAAWNDEAALAAAARLDAARHSGGAIGRMHGVPITVKDWIDVEGLPCTGGYIECRHRMPKRDATVVARMREQGAIVVAKTAVQVDSALFGKVRNPGDPARSPGGSSSGEAAAIAGGGSVVGIASDSGGSIRLPAAWCGVAALKPSAGRVPTTGHFPRVGDRSDGRTQVGPMATSVSRLIEAFAVIAGPDGHDAGIAPVEVANPATVNLEDLRVGWAIGDAQGDGAASVLAPAIQAAVVEGVATLERLGARIVGEVPQHFDEALDITRRYWQRAGGQSDGVETERQLADWDRYRSRMLRAHEAVDVVIMPVVASTAPLHRDMNATDYIFTLPASLTGAPAVVIPFGDDQGLPIAVQVVARPWRDDIALAAARALER